MPFSLQKKNLHASFLLMKSMQSVRSVSIGNAITQFLVKQSCFVAGKTICFDPSVTMCSEVSGDREVQRTMLELLNQLDGFSSDERIKV